METAKKNTPLIDTRTEVSLQEKAFLVHGSKKVPIRAEIASKYSLFFKYKENHDLAHSEEPVNLLIRNNGQSVELGPCRILPIPVSDDYHGRLVFLHEVYDIKSLLKENKIVNLQSAVNDLPLIFARKEKIKPIFKFYVADLKYDLQVYKKFFDDLDEQYAEEPEDVRKAIQKAIIKTEKDKLKQFLGQKLDELERIVSDFSKEEHQHHGYYFRKQLWNFILCCPIFARTNLKPRGYPGVGL